MKHTATRFTAFLAALLFTLPAWITEAAETVLDRRGDWMLIQTDAPDTKTLSLADANGGSRAVLSTMTLPTELVTNVYWDAYAIWVPEMNGHIGALVTNVSPVGADYEYRAFLNDGRAYWEDWFAGTQRLWTATCAQPSAKTQLASFHHEDTEETPAAAFFCVTPFGSGVIWEQPTAAMAESGRDDGFGEVVAWTNGVASVVVSNTYFATWNRSGFNDFSEIDRTDRFFWQSATSRLSSYWSDGQTFFEDSFTRHGLWLLTPSSRQTVWQTIDSFWPAKIPTWPTGETIEGEPVVPFWTADGIVVRGVDHAVLPNPPSVLVVDSLFPLDDWATTDSRGNVSFSVTAHSAAGGAVAYAWTVDGETAGGKSTFVLNIPPDSVRTVNCRVFGSEGEKPIDLVWIAGSASALATAYTAKVATLDDGLYELTLAALSPGGPVSWRDVDSGTIVGTDSTLRVATLFGTNSYRPLASASSVTLPDLSAMTGRQRWPWTTDVDLEWIAGGPALAELLPGSTIRVVPTVRDAVAGTDLHAATFRDANTGNAASSFDIAVGSTGRMVWVAGNDLPASYRTTNAEAKATGAFRAAYLLHFDANGGLGELPAEFFAPGEEKPLTSAFYDNYGNRQCHFERWGYIFAGWATSPDGPMTFADAAVVSDLSDKAGIVPLYVVWTPISYTVHFDANGGTGSMADQTFVFGSGIPLRTNSFTRPGHLFAGWTWTADGTEPRWTDGADGSHLGYENGAVETLYAVWTPLPYQVCFDANGGTGTMAPQEFIPDVEQSLRPNAFSRTGYSFAGWARSPSGAVAHADGATVSNLSASGESVTLYAVWTPNTYTVHFDPNGGSGIMNDQSFRYGTSQSLRANTFNRPGYIFAGWAKTASGGVVYADRATVSNLTTQANATVTLYAVWRQTYRVVFDANGGKGIMSPQNISLGETVALTPNTFARKGYAFAGWALSKKGGIVYADSAQVSDLTTEADGVVTLYARWTPNTYTVHFDANGGTGSMANQSFTYEGGGTLRPNAFSKDGLTFMGWATTPTGFTVYPDRAVADTLTAAPDATVTLYAEWGGKYMVVDLSEGVDASSYPVSYLDEPPGGDWTEDYKTTRIVLRRIEPGSFSMGNGSYDYPLHTVTISHAFYIGIFEVTQKQWELVTDGTPSEYVGDTRPVECVSYNNIRGTVRGTNWPSDNAVDSASFLGKLRAKTGVAFDLPTEAQWEYACRAGTTTDLNNGQDLSSDTKDSAMNDVGRYYYNGGDTRQHARVGLYAPNAWGLYDMHGNVSEWCLDWYDAYPSGDAVDPAGAFSGSDRVRRGGFFRNTAAPCRSSARATDKPGTGGDANGFRLAFSSKSGTAVLRFDANGGDGSMSDQMWPRGEAVFLSPCSFTRRAFQFAGWATSPTGPVVYDDCETVADMAASVLYAVWTPCYTLQFDANGGAGNMADLDVVADSGQTLPPNAFSREGYDFVGWSLNPNGPTAYKNADSIPEFSVSLGGTMTLYAIWQGHPYTIHFDANGGAGTMTDQSSTYDDDPVVLTPNAFSRTGYTFSGWATNAEGGVAYSDRQTVNNLANPGSTVTLFAKWTPISYKVHFDANGGSGAMEDQFFVYDVAQNLNANAFTRDGFVFWGWSTTPAGAVAFHNVASVSNLSSQVGTVVSLYAQWISFGFVNYLIVDLSGGLLSETWPLEALTSVPETGWTDEYKTTKLVLRRIEPGTFMMCGEYQTTLTKPYYIGVFEVTQKQWELVMGSGTALHKGDARPVERVSYNMIRGGAAGAGWGGGGGGGGGGGAGKQRGGRRQLPGQAQGEDGGGFRPADGGTVGIRLPCGDDERIQQRRQFYERLESAGAVLGQHKRLQGRIRHTHESRELPAECVGSLRHARERDGVVPGLEREFDKWSDGPSGFVFGSVPGEARWGLCHLRRRLHVVLAGLQLPDGRELRLRLPSCQNPVRITTMPRESGGGWRFGTR